MKKRSLAAAFALVAGITAIGAGTAQAQTVPVNGGQVWNEQVPVSQASVPVSQQAIDDLAYNVGVQTAYYRAGVGFTQGTASTGETIGLEFQLNGQNATVVRAYNLNDPNARATFQGEVNNAAMRDNQLASQESYGAASYAYYQPQSYVICAPVVPIISFGFAIHGWYAGYTPIWMMPTWRPWGGFWEGGHRIGGNRTTIIENNYYGGNRDNHHWVGGNRGNVYEHNNIYQHNNVIPRNNVVPRNTYTPRNNVIPQTTYPHNNVNLHNNVAPPATHFNNVAPVRTYTPPAAPRMPANNNFGGGFHQQTGAAPRVNAPPAHYGRR